MRKKRTKLSLEVIYNKFAIFFFGTISLMILILYGNELIKNPNLNFIFQSLALITFSCYFFNFTSFVIYYLTKASKVARDSYEKHYLSYWIATIFVFLALILICGYFVLGVKKLTEIVISAGLIGLFGLAGWLFKNYYESRFKKVFKKK